MWRYALTAPGEGAIHPVLDVLPGLRVGVYGDGLLSVLDRDYGQGLLESWEWLVGTGTVALVTTGLGDVFYWAGVEVRWLNVQRATTEAVDADAGWFLREFLSTEVVVERVLQQRLLSQLIRLNRPLAYQEAFILRPWLMLGGVDLPEHYEIGHCGVYVDLVGQAAFQLQQLEGSH